jgi:hypothetical protein
MLKVGEIYLAIDPTTTSGSLVDLHRIWAERVPVELVTIHRARIRNRYTVRGPDGTEWETGRLEPLKQVRPLACV